MKKYKKIITINKEWDDRFILIEDKNNLQANSLKKTKTTRSTKIIKYKKRR